MIAALVALAPVLTPFAEALVAAAAAYFTAKAIIPFSGKLLDTLRAAREQRAVVLPTLTTADFQNLAHLTLAQAQALGAQMDAQLRLSLITQISTLVNGSFASLDDIQSAYQLIASYAQDGLVWGDNVVAWNLTLEQKYQAMSAAPAAPTPAPAAASMLPGAKWGSGTQLQLASGQKVLIMGQVAGAPVIAYTVTWLATGLSSTLPEKVLLDAGAQVIVGGGTAVLPVSVPTVTPSPTETTATGAGTIVTTTPTVNVNVPPTTVNVTAQAPMVNVAPNINVDTGSIAAALPLLGVSLVSSLTAAAENIGCGMNRGVVGCQATTGQQLLQTLMKGIAPLGMMLFLENPTIAERFTDPITRAMFDQLLTIPELGKPVQPGDAPTLARKLFERAVGLGIGAHIAAQVSEASTPMKTLGMGYVAAFLADLAGFSRIAAATMGVLETQALQVPMRYYINQHVRSILPDIRTASEMVGHRKLSQGRFNELLGFHGIPPEFENAYWSMAFQPATYFMLRAMADAGIWDPEYYREQLQDRGYTDPTVQHGLDMLYAMAHGELKPLFVSTAITRYKNGLDDEAKLQDNLLMLGVRQELLPKYLAGARLQENLDDFQDYLAVLKAAVQKGAIEPPDMKDMLIARGMREGRADQLAQLEALRLLPKKKATPSAA